VSLGKKRGDEGRKTREDEGSREMTKSHSTQGRGV
jgi:hypothetical protein